MGLITRHEPTVGRKGLGGREAAGGMVLVDIYMYKNIKLYPNKNQKVSMNEVKAAVSVEGRLHYLTLSPSVPFYTQPNHPS